MNIRDITIAWLKQNKFDGLACDECGCGVDDLMPCDSPSITECGPARAVLCNGTCANCESTEGVDFCYRYETMEQNEEETHL